MPIPDFQTIMLPYLEVLDGVGKMTTAQVNDALADRFQLTDEERVQMQPSGLVKLFQNRAQWAKFHMAKAGLLETPARGVVCLSDDGRDVLADPPERIDISYLKQFDAYVAFQNAKGKMHTAADELSEPDELAAPFDQLFGDIENANRVLNWFARVLSELKCDPDVQDVRTSISIQRWSGQRIQLRLNYAKWAVFGYRMQRETAAYQLILPQGDPGERLMGDTFTFVETIDDTAYVLGWISEVDFDKHGEALWPSIRESLHSVHRCFSHWALTPYGKSNRFELYSMILNEDRRLEVLQAGIDESGTVSSLSKMNYWLIAPGRGAEFWTDWLDDGIMSIGWEDAGSLEEFETKAELVDAIKTSYPEDGPKKVAYMLWAFRRTMNHGDIVFARRGRQNILGWGVVTSSYKYDPGRSPHPHFRSVDWKDTAELPVPGSYDSMLAIQTLTLMSDKPDFLDAMSNVYSGIPGLEESPLVSDMDGVQRSWWLSANPSQWDPAGFGVGHEEFYTPYNDRGVLRRLPQAFRNARPGDTIVIYVTSPQRYLWGFATVTAGLKETDEKELRFRLETPFERRVPLEEMKVEPGLAHCVPLIQPQGSLFPLSPDEFKILMNLADRDKAVTPLPRFSREDALNDLFMEPEKLDRIVGLLKRKRNVILQGAPGTGKTFVARRIAYLLMGEKAASRAPMMQFHQSTTYEDFIQGYRPDGKGGFTLKDGIFHEFCRRAVLQPNREFVFIIDEINRGNLSKVFGELMMLIEADKRDASFAIQLSYSNDKDGAFYVPPNIYLLGTMNTADRSLSLVDFALRRRFAFVELEPGFDSPEFETCLATKGVSAGVIATIRNRMNQLNAYILQDVHNLGRGFCIGHSFFVSSDLVDDDVQWLNDVIEYEIVPLVEEYWGDDERRRAQALGIIRG